MNNTVKSHYSLAELFELNLKSLNCSFRTLNRKAKKWECRPRNSRGGGVEYAFEGLPKNVQAEIKQRQYKQMMSAGNAKSKQLVTQRQQKEVAILERDLDELNGYQRDAAIARIRMVLLVEQWRAENAVGLVNACTAISKLSRDEALPIDDADDFNTVCAVARDGTYKQKGVGLRKLQQWCIDYQKYDSRDDRMRALAPRKRGHKLIEPLQCDWLSDFLKFYCQPQCYSVAESYRLFKQEMLLREKTDIPSLGVVRRVHKRLPKSVQTKGRASGGARRALYGFVRRDWNAEWMHVNDVWVGDGHSLKVRVKHPQHGQPFNPELTLIMDAASRYIVGWSVSFSESTVAVGDALRHGFMFFGFCVIYYSDNGGGQKNKTFDTDMTGAFAELGIEHPTGIPGNPQGRGIIERQMKEVPKRVAKAFATYHGKDADPTYVRNMLGATDAYKRAVVNKKKPEKMTDKERKGGEILPTFDELMVEIERQVHDYNHNRKHRSIGTTPARMRERLLAQHGTELKMPTEYDLKHMFRPHFVRTVSRAEVRHDNKFYRDKALEDFEGVKVAVYIDIHDPMSVVVKDLEGKYICEAGLNNVDAFPQSYVESAREKSNKARIKRAQNQIDAIEAESRKTLGHEGGATLADLVGDDWLEGEFVDKSDEPKRELDMFAMPDDWQNAI